MRRTDVKSWTKTAAALAVLTLIGLPAPIALAQPAPAATLPDPATTLFCENNDGDIQPMPYVTLGTVTRKYQTRYHFNLSVQAKPMALVFSNPAESEFYISYEAAPYHDDNGHTGIALLSAHVVLENVDEVFRGIGLCYFTARG
jgi:hypothetical protein